MPAAIAERYAGKLDATRPDRAEEPQHQLEDFRGRNLPAASRPVIKEFAWACRRTEQGRVCRAYLARATQQRGAPLDPEQFVPSVMPECAGEPFRRKPRQSFGIGSPWVGGIGGEEARLHRAQARNRKAFGARQHLTRLRLVKTPLRPGSGIEQNGDDGQIDTGACRFGRIGARSHKRPAVDPASREVPPPAVIWHGEIRIAQSRDVEDAPDRLIQPRHNKPKMPGLAMLGRSKDDAASLPYGSRGQ